MLKISLLGLNNNTRYQVETIYFSQQLSKETFTRATLTLPSTSLLPHIGQPLVFHIASANKQQFFAGVVSTLAVYPNSNSKTIHMTLQLEPAWQYQLKQARPQMHWCHHTLTHIVSQLFPDLIDVLLKPANLNDFFDYALCQNESAWHCVQRLLSDKQIHHIPKYQSNKLYWHWLTQPGKPCSFFDIKNIRYQLNHSLKNLNTLSVSTATLQALHCADTVSFNQKRWVVLAHTLTYCASQKNQPGALSQHYTLGSETDWPQYFKRYQTPQVSNLTSALTNENTQTNTCQIYYPWTSQPTLPRPFRLHSLGQGQQFFIAPQAKTSLLVSPLSQWNTPIIISQTLPDSPTLKADHWYWLGSHHQRHQYAFTWQLNTRSMQFKLSVLGTLKLQSRTSQMQASQFNVFAKKQIQFNTETSTINSQKKIHLQAGSSSIIINANCIQLKANKITLAQGQAVACVGDLQQCPQYHGTTPHQGGVILTGSNSVTIQRKAVATVGSQAQCHGAKTEINSGSSSVFVEGRPIARKNDTTSHQGQITTGCSGVTA